jgi:eukaryotic-like serine/threonine-protein kinase
MATAIHHFLDKVQRTLARTDRASAAGRGATSYRVTAVNEPFIDQKIGNCLVLSRIGQGAMSVVYKARQDITERIVAIKLLRTQLTYDPNNVKRFQREAKAIARLKHPNLLSVYEVGSANTGQPYMVMDFIEGRSLGELVEVRGAIPWQRALPFFLQICDAMAHAHANKIIHRDLKPDNIMLVKSPDGEDLIKVVDFGIVKLTDEQTASQRLTATGEVWGSPVYMSPEQCMGKAVDARADIYALGLVFYECLTGVQTFKGKRIADVIMKQISEKPQPFAAVAPSLQIPDWLEAVIMKALEKDPLNRFQSMRDLKREIEICMLASERKDTAEGIQKPGYSPSADTRHLGVIITPPEGPEDEFINRVIGGKYLVQAKLGEGGMSVVYRAIHQNMNTHVAIKVMRDELSDDEAYRKRFQREAKALSSLKHPNLVSIYDVGIAHTGQSYIVMEYLDGAALSDVLDDKGFLAPKRAVPIFIQICDVMNYLHEQGVIHRDLKPHNIMLVELAGQKDYVKVVDFGILKFDDSKHVVSQVLTASGDICGSPIYMSPEQILDEKLDGRCDIYALGVAMYETVLGTPPFTGRRVAELLNCHINAAPKPFIQARPDLRFPPSLEVIILRALEKERDMRYQTMAGMKEDLVTLQGRLEQEMMAVMNGQPLDGLPPLPVAGRMASASAVMPAPAKSVAAKGAELVAKSNAASPQRGGSMAASSKTAQLPSLAATGAKLPLPLVALIIGLAMACILAAFVLPKFLVGLTHGKPGPADSHRADTTPLKQPDRINTRSKAPPIPVFNNVTGTKAPSKLKSGLKSIKPKSGKPSNNRFRTTPLGEEIEIIEESYLGQPNRVSKDVFTGVRPDRQ